MKSKYWLHEEMHSHFYMNTYLSEFLAQPHKFKLYNKYTVKVDAVPWWGEEADWCRCTVLKLNLNDCEYETVLV